MRILDKIIYNDFILYDLEYTSWSGSKETGWTRPGEHREIVEIGAIRVTMQSSKIFVTDEFSVIVKPNINTEISQYFTDLTGITQNEVSLSGNAFITAWQKFKLFIKKDIQLLSFGEDDEIIEENLRLNMMSMDINKKRFINYRTMLCNEFSLPDKICSADLPLAFGIDIKPVGHRALNDVYSQFEVFKKAISIRSLDENQK